MHRGGPGRPLEPLAPRPPGAGGPSSSPRGGGTKTALSGGEFWKVVGEYERCLREGGEFDRDVVEFKYWRRRNTWGRDWR